MDNIIYKTIVNVAIGINIGLILYAMITVNWSLIPLSMVNLLLLSFPAFLKLRDEVEK